MKLSTAKTLYSFFMTLTLIAGGVGASLGTLLLIEDGFPVAGIALSAVFTIAIVGLMEMDCTIAYKQAMEDVPCDSKKNT